MIKGGIFTLGVATLLLAGGFGSHQQTMAGVSALPTPGEMCSICDSIMDQLEIAISADSGSSQHVDLRNRLNPRGQRYGKLIDYKNSEVRLFNILDSFCSNLNDRVEYKTPLSPAEGSADGDNGLFVDTKFLQHQYTSPLRRIAKTKKKDLEHYCVSFINTNESRIWDLIRADASFADYRREFCHNVPFVSESLGSSDVVVTGSRFDVNKTTGEVDEIVNASTSFAVEAAARSAAARAAEENQENQEKLEVDQVADEKPVEGEKSATNPMKKNKSRKKKNISLVGACLNRPSAVSIESLYAERKRDGIAADVTKRAEEEAAKKKDLEEKERANKALAEEVVAAAAASAAAETAGVEDGKESIETETPANIDTATVENTVVENNSESAAVIPDPAESPQAHDEL